MWINSMQIEDAFVVDLYDDVRDGLLLLRVCHRIDDTTVDLTKPNYKPKNMFDRNFNCDMCIEAMQKLRVRLVGIGSQDIRDGVKKNVLAMVWQLMRVHYLKIIGSKTEADLLAWVNATCQPESEIKSFNDPQFADGRVLIKLSQAIEPRIINWDLVTPGETDEEKELNAKYAISIARKLGAIVFLVWDDIPKLNKKMILIFVCAMYDLKHSVA